MSSPLMSMLKWYRSEEGYRRRTQGGSSMTTPASQTTSHDLCVWLKWAKDTRQQAVGKLKRWPTPWKFINHKCAYTNYVFSVGMGGTVYSRLAWESCVDTEVPVDPKEWPNASLPVPPRRSVKALGNTRENLPHHKLNPSAARGVGHEGWSKDLSTALTLFW